MLTRNTRTETYTNVHKRTQTYTNVHMHTRKRIHEYMLTRHAHAHAGLVIISVDLVTARRRHADPEADPVYAYLFVVGTEHS